MSLKTQLEAKRAAKRAEQDRRAAAEETRKQAQYRREFGRRMWPQLGSLTLGADQVRDLVIAAWSALDALPTGRGEECHIHTLACVANMSLLLSEIGYGAEALEDIKRGQDAVVSVMGRYARTGRAGCSGQELQLLRTLVDVHEQQLSLSPTRDEMLRVIAEMRRRMAAGEVLEVAA
jgi:hypothetical protein